MNYYSSTSFNPYRQQDDLKRVISLINDLDSDLPTNSIEIPLTDKEILTAILEGDKCAK